ncbi:N-acetyltransferase Ard1-like protein [Aduncisulcus paluster]|uniref:N-acetyltransferase Ard1-like protein n=1 Tax=Aduncisulcus paluster TaxID=2918883 RepID=A0ABQ5K2C0_9EUKA|nr:N-acetyltransferase Ard1-like protein [Aduncisulcus paluster]
MLTIRRATPSDLIGLQEGNLSSLPENYQLMYFIYHQISWEPLLWVAVERGHIVGYVLSKMETEGKKGKKTIKHGHITSIAVNRTHRRQGLATKLMKLALREMGRVFKAEYCSLHVRLSNVAAKHLYIDTLGFKKHETTEKYYADGEDAFECRYYFSDVEKELKAEEKEEKEEKEGK